MNATQIIAVQILKIEGICTPERGKIVQGKEKKKRARGGVREIEGFLILEGERERCEDDWEAEGGGWLLKSSN